MFKTIKSWFAPAKEEQRSITSNFGSYLGLEKSLANVLVNDQTALNLSAVFAAIHNKSDDFASLPCKVFDADSKEVAKQHPVYRLLHHKPNNITSNIMFRKALIVEAHTNGNGYALIIRNSAGVAVALENLCSTRVRIEYDGNALTYLVDNKVRLNSDDLIHLRYFTLDGIRGISPIDYAKTSLGIALAADRTAAAYFGNGAKPAGMLSFDMGLNEEAMEAIRSSWSLAHSGDKAGSTAVVPFGGKYQPLTMSFEQMQFIQLRQFSTLEICRWFKVQPHKVGELGRATWGNIASESLAYVRDCIRPLTLQYEEECLKLFAPSERDAYYVEHDFKELLRADPLTQHKVFEIGLRSGIYSVNEARQWLNLLPIQGGDIHTIAMNQQDIESAEIDAMTDQQEPPPAEEDTLGN